MEGEKEKQMRNYEENGQTIFEDSEEQKTIVCNDAKDRNEGSYVKSIKYNQIDKETQGNSISQSVKDDVKDMKDNQEDESTHSKGGIQIVAFRNDMKERSATDDESKKIGKTVTVIKVKKSERYDPHLKRAVKKYAYKKNYQNENSEFNDTPPDMEYNEGLGLSEEDFFFSDPDEEKEADQTELLLRCFVEDEKEYRLKLESDLCKRLSKEANYFESLLNLNMMEKKRGFAKIPAEVFPEFLKICQIVMGYEYIEVKNINSLCSLYITANYYGVSLATDVCRDLLEKHICDRNAELISHLADEFGDEFLKDLVLRQSDSASKYSQNSMNADWGIEPLQIDIENEREKFNFYY